jgi:Ser/Thr protein kinase RdoA (MazF antagonist)
MQEPESLQQAALAFGLGDASELSLEVIAGGSNNLWRVSGEPGVFVLKELRRAGPLAFAKLREAAAFENSLYRANVIEMAEPRLDARGEVILPFERASGIQAFARVHRFVDGVPARTAVQNCDRDLIESAGLSLARIQEAGCRWKSRSGESLRDGQQKALEIASRTQHGVPVVIDRGLISAALEILSEADATPGSWIFCHRDHKPENVLVRSGAPVILDWDQCALCHPRLEAVEAALRWAGAPQPERLRFDAFVRGYTSYGASLSELRESDFAQWISGLLGWLSFQSRMACGEWPDATEAQRLQAAKLAVEAQEDLKRAVASLAEWVTWI